MRSLPVLLVLASFTCGSLSAQLLVHENFNYAAGSVNGVVTAGTGISGNWYAGPTGGSGSSASASFVADSLTFAGHFASVGGALRVSNPSGPGYGEAAASATMSAALSGYSTLYVSTVMRMNTAGQYYNDWTVEQRFNSSQTGNYSSTSGRNLLSAFGSGSASLRKAGVSSDSSEVTQSTGSIQPGTNYLFVTAYTVSGSNITGATLYVFNEAAYSSYLTAATPATASGLLSSHALFSLSDNQSRALSNFNYLQFAILGGPTGTFDDFRMGASLTDVVNVVAIPEPSTTVVFAAVLALGLVWVCRYRNSRVL